MANIGALALKLTANAAELSKTLKMAEDSIGKFAENAEKKAKKVDFATALKTNIATFKSNLDALQNNTVDYFASWVKMIPGGWGSFLALPFEGLSAVLGIADQGATAIKTMGDAAERAGMELADYNVLVRATGGHSEATEKALFKMNQHLAESATASLVAKDSFEWLGLSGKKLADMSAMGAYREIAEAIKNMGDKAMQARAAFQIFGKQGRDMLPHLLKGAEGIDKWAKSVDRWGLGIGGNDLKNVKEAQEAGKSLKMFWEGVNNQITLAVVPILAQLKDGLGGWMDSLGDKAKMKEWSGWIVDGVATVSTSFAWFADQVPGWWDKVVKGAKAAGGAIEDFALDALTGLAPVIKEIEKLARTLASTEGNATRKLGAFRGFGLDLTYGIGRALGLFPAPAGSDPPAAAAFDALITKLTKRKEERAKAAAAGGGAAGGWSWLSLIGLGTPTDTLENKVKQFFEGVRKRMKGLGEEGDKAAATWAKYYERFEALKTSLETPLDAFDKQRKELFDMKKAGIFGHDPSPWGMFEKQLKDAEDLAKGTMPFTEPMLLPGADMDLFHRGLSKTYMDLVKANPVEIKGVGALLEGTSAAASAIAAYKRGAPDNVQEQIKRILEEQKMLQKEQVKVGQEVADAIRRIFKVGF